MSQPSSFQGIGVSREEEINWKQLTFYMKRLLHWKED